MSNRWEPMPPMPTPRRWCGAAALTGRVYVIGGHRQGRTLGTVECFEAESHTWKAMPGLRTPREACAVTMCSGGLYVLGGSENEQALPTAERLQLVSSEHAAASETWETLEDMPSPRDACAAASAWGRILVAGGRDAFDFLASADLLDVATLGVVEGGWLPLIPMPTPRLGCTAVACDGCMFICGGHGGTGRALATIERFDLSSYSWESIVSMPTPRLGCVALVGSLLGKHFLCVFGGHEGNGPVNAAESLEVQCDNSEPRAPSKCWNTLPRFRTARYGCAAASMAW